MRWVLCLLEADEFRACPLASEGDALLTSGLVPLRRAALQLTAATCRGLDEVWIVTWDMTRSHAMDLELCLCASGEIGDVTRSVGWFESPTKARVTLTVEPGTAERW